MLPAPTRPPGAMSNSAAPADEEEEILVCENCGAAVDPVGSYCWKCGVPLEMGTEPYAPAPPGPTQPYVPGPPSSPTGLPAYRSRTPAPERFSGRRSLRTRESNLRVVFLLLGLLLLLASVFLGWYATSATASYTYGGQPATLTGTATQYPFNHYFESVTCEGTASCFANNSFTASNSGNVAGLYDAVGAIAVGGIIAGVAGIAISLTGIRTRSKLVSLLALLAIVLTLSAPIVLLAAQPGVLSAQGAPGGSSGNPSTGASPRTSFFGSCSGTSCGSALTPGQTESADWGPGLGWYLALMAAIPLILGFLIGRAPARASLRQNIYGPG